MLLGSKQDNLELGGSHLYSMQFLTPIFLKLDIKRVHSILCLHDVVHIFKLEYPSIMEKFFSLKDGIHFSYAAESYNWSILQGAEDTNLSTESLTDFHGW